MLVYLKNLARRKPVKAAPLLGQRSEDFKVRNAQFVSFLTQSGFRKRQIARHQKTRLLKKFVALACMWTLFGGFIWVVIESAQALEKF